MKFKLITITKSMVYLLGLAVIVVCAILLPELAREEKTSNPNVSSAMPFLIGAWIMSIPIFIALWHTIKLLNLVDKGLAFSKQSVKALQNIKVCAAAFTLLVLAGASLVIIIARLENPTEDVTPVVTFGFIFTFISTAIAIFVAVVQKLINDAINMKKENDLII